MKSRPALVGLLLVMVVSRAALAQEELACSLDLLTKEHTRATGFATLQDVTLDIRLRNTSKDTARVLMDTEQGSAWAVPLLFEIKLDRESGGLALPTWELFENFDRQGSSNTLAYLTEVRELRAREVIHKHASLNDWLGWQGIDLPPGTYLMQIAYTGATSKSIATSEPVRLTITGRKSELRWSKPEKGLRTAIALRPEGARYFFDESIEPMCFVENVGNAPLELERDVPYAEYDDLEVFDTSGAPFAEHMEMHRTGWHPIIRWTLPPASHIRVPFGPLRLEDSQTEHATVGRLAAPPGKYTLEYRLGVNGHVLIMPRITIEILHR